MVEEASALLNKGDTELLRGLKDWNIVLAAGGRCNVSHARPPKSEDVVDEGELRTGSAVE
jgi:hypothetical protein